VKDLTRLHVHEMARLLRTGEVSSHALTEAHLAAAGRQNHALNAWLVIDRKPPTSASPKLAGPVRLPLPLSIRCAESQSGSRISSP
jgi:Asp-tRNA(Asn)/Glu-tRNA(Gln) amidotransferase A subunit family amidase